MRIQRYELEIAREMNRNLAEAFKDFTRWFTTFIEYVDRRTVCCPIEPDTSEPDDWRAAVEEGIADMKRWHNTTEACAVLRILADRIELLEQQS